MDPIHVYLLWSAFFVLFFASMFWAEKKDAKQPLGHNKKIHKLPKNTKSKTTLPSFSLN